jgi:hypothetical protein
MAQTANNELLRDFEDMVAQSIVESSQPVAAVH